MSIKQREAIEASFKNHDSLYNNLGKYIATYLHLTNTYRIKETKKKKLFTEILGYKELRTCENKEDFKVICENNILQKLEKDLTAED